ncbi:tRNA (adenosine(37)-N6)-dimethylallyltransferase MiaA [Aestuariicoccus sp. MJ-SS9]|uniref:tRNA (adenosine(37)-N6)-dimethylallyltransferase MiaA n=1 Tax=Aestuariicoccus sp. MJ-SS9 TaxID=3079855 RepID=UPI002908828C|nr:tRNA (adenosine(37)-N6)-dimethylallyltransferase MiaA [Aestuariicoccus sp. MJ-SS9]MDU8913033.1 tRNA (adenosine(37)-N6)-dimethylallyltransferase MiaA [Aestuariicoccus sp. MJ-SS9]
MTLPQIAPDRPVLIAGPTASGKSALALRIARDQGGVVVNADAIQVYANWRILTARPSPEDEAQARHLLYGHVPGDAPYSVGQWLRDLEPILQGPDRPIIVGGTGLYFSALTEGLADIPATTPEMRARADAELRERGLAAMVEALDAESRARIDTANPMRVQRAWEVLQMTGRGIAAWQDDTPPPRLPLDRVTPILFDLPKEVLNTRIAARFQAMLEQGALDEARANEPGWSPALPSAKAIGAAELIAHLRGEMTLDKAAERATIATRQFAKRQRTWFRARMSGWHRYTPEGAAA